MDDKPTSEIPEAFKGLCRKCAHRSTCKAPCRPVQLILNHDNSKPFEQDINGQLVLYPMLRCFIRESEFPLTDKGKPKGKKQRAFSDQHESPFATGSDFELKKTNIFIDLFFHKKTYAELAKKYGCSKSTIGMSYKSAQERLLKVVAALDRAKIARSNGKPLVKMTKMVRVFFLHAAFGLPIHEIAKLLDISTGMVVKNIKTTRDRILAGEIDLLNADDAEREAAMARLAAARQKDNERCNNRYHQKRERLREKAAGDGPV